MLHLNISNRKRLGELLWKSSNNNQQTVWKRWKTIGYMLAEKLGIPCYSREILQRASEEVVLMRVCSMHEMNAWKGYRNSCYPPTYIVVNSFHRKAKNLHQIKNLFNYEAEIIKKIRSRRFLRIDRTMRWLCLKRRSGYDQRIRSCRSRFPDESALERVSMSEKRWRNTSNEPTNTVQTSIIITQEEAGMMQKIMTCASTVENWIWKDCRTDWILYQYK